MKQTSKRLHTEFSSKLLSWLLETKKRYKWNKEIRFWYGRKKRNSGRKCWKPTWFSYSRDAVHFEHGDTAGEGSPREIRQ